MTFVAGQLHTLKDGIFFMKRFNQFPCLVLRSVIYKYNAAVCADFPLFHKEQHLCFELSRSFRQNLFFVIAWNNQI